MSESPRPTAPRQPADRYWPVTTVLKRSSGGVRIRVRMKTTEHRWLTHSELQGFPVKCLALRYLEDSPGKAPHAEIETADN
jgi:hypothetical protein